MLRLTVSASPAVWSPGFGIYIHWPFCLTKCPYCDFNSHVAAVIDQDRWRRAYLAELNRGAAATAGRTVTSVFFGGGTPSLMPPATVAALLEAIAGHWPLASDLEVTLEANPTSVEAARFADLRAAGVNRLSLGVQALDDQALRLLGRGHDTAGAVAAIGLAARHFDRFSFDLIYARPGQTVAAWRDELARAAALAGDHLSAYQLTVEPGTAFHPRHVRGDLPLPDEDTAADLFEATQEVLAFHGLPAYEISNHARPGQECRHNLTTWRCGNGLGIGPGAHGRLGRPDGSRVATHNHRAPAVWLAAVEEHGHGGLPPEPLDAAARREELLLLGLRLTEGVSPAAARAGFGCDLPALLDGATVARLSAGGFLVLDAAGLRATPAGHQRLNAVLAALV
jgi:oxygen-independent coproporphyrinogen-3 oxidase